MQDTIHNRIIANARIDGWQVGPWREAFFAKAKANEDWAWEIEVDTDDDGRYELFDGIISRPDAWRLVVEGPETEKPDGDPWSYPVLVLEFLEVEISHPMPLRKRDEYMRLWWTLDATSCFHFRVYRAERYGPIKLWLDTEAAYFDLAQRPVPRSPAGAA